MNEFQKNFTSEEVVILLFDYAVNFNIFNELLSNLIIQIIKPNFVETVESN